MAVGLVLFGGRDDDDFDDEASAVCTEFADRIQREFALSFPEGPPSGAAFAEYLSHAFADTMDALLAELDSLDPPDDVAAVLDDYRAVLAEVRSRPSEFVSTPPFDEVAAQMDAESVPACGTEFFAALRAQE